MRVVHRKDDVLGSGETAQQHTLATNVELADSTLSQARGLMFRSSIPEDFALVMELGNGGGLPFSSGLSRQFVHMLCMRFPIDVLWLQGDRVVERKRLSPWTGYGVARADRIIELPAGAADGVDIDDTVRVEGLDGGGEDGDERAGD